MYMNGEYVEECKRFPNYYVSRSGKVFSAYVYGGQGLINPNTLRELSYKVDRYGYYKVTLAVPLYRSATGKLKRVKYITVHRLVAEQYLNDWDPNLQVNHKDLNKLNNNINNLEMVTSQENIKHLWKMSPNKQANCAKKVLVVDNTVNKTYTFNSFKQCHLYFPDISLYLLRKVETNEINDYKYYCMIWDAQTKKVEVYGNGILIHTFENIGSTAVFFSKTERNIKYKCSNKKDTIYKKYHIQILSQSTIESVSNRETFYPVNE